MHISNDVAIAIKKTNEFLSKIKKNDCIIFQSWNNEYCQYQEYSGPYLVEKATLGVIEEKKGLLGTKYDLVHEPELIVRDLRIYAYNKFTTQPFNLLAIKKGYKTNTCTLKGWQTIYIPASVSPIIKEGVLNKDIGFLNTEETLSRVKLFQEKIQEIERQKQAQIEAEKKRPEMIKQYEEQREEASKTIDAIFQDIDKVSQS